MKRSYGQHCAVARALDVVGERWTLLLVRELLLGPRRYSDLLAGLPGVGTNLLAERLRDLESAGVIQRRTLPPPAASTVYELTELGHELRPALLELGRWGARFLGRPTGAESMRPGWYVLSMIATFRPEVAGDGDATYELRVDGERFQIRVRNGEAVIVGEPQVADPDLVLTCDLMTFLGLLGGEVSPTGALRDRRIEIEGDRTALIRFHETFRWPMPEAAAKATSAAPHAR